MGGRPPDDSALAERAFEELVRMHQGIAFRTGLLLTGSAADAEEAAQTGFVEAWAAFPRFRPGAPFRPWLLRIVANEAHHRRRTAGRRADLRLRATAAHPSGDARGPRSGESGGPSCSPRSAGSTGRAASS